MANNIKTFEQFINEEQVYGMFNDNNGKPTKISKELLDICLKGLPKDIISNIEEVEPAGWATQMKSPPTVSNKGQSRGEIEYKTIKYINHVRYN